MILIHDFKPSIRCAHAVSLIVVDAGSLGVRRFALPALFQCSGWRAGLPRITSPESSGGLMVKLAIEFENPAKLWWESGGRELWDSIAYGFDGNEVLVDDDVAQSWMAQAATIPGWQGGPNYAPHPVFVKSVNEDEEL